MGRKKQDIRLGARPVLRWTLDVLEAQASFTQADSNRSQALYVHANARATLRYVMARDPLDDTPAVAPAGDPGAAGDERSR